MEENLEGAQGEAGTPSRRPGLWSRQVGTVARTRWRQGRCRGLAGVEAAELADGLRVVE